MNWIIVALLLTSQAVKVESKAAVGDKATVSVESTLDLEIVVKDSNGESTRLLNTTRQEKFIQETTRAAGGSPEAVSIHCASSTLQKSGTNLPLESAPTALAEKDFAVVRTAAGWSVKLADGTDAPVEAEGLGAWNDAAKLLPAGEAKVGNKWQVEAAKLAFLLHAAGSANYDGTLDCQVESIADGKATVLMTGALEGLAEDGTSLKVTIAAGRLVFNSAKGRVASVTLSGSFESTREVVELFRKPGEFQDQKRRVGEITAKSRKFELQLSVE